MNKNRLKVYILEFISVILIALNICIFGWFMAHSVKAVDLSYKSSFGIIRIILPSLATLLFLFMIMSIIINLTVRKNKKYVFSIHFIHPLVASIIWFVSNILVVVSLHTMNSRYMTGTLYLESFLKMKKVFTFSYYIMFMCSSMLVISVILLLCRICFHKEKINVIETENLEVVTEKLEMVTESNEEFKEEFKENLTENESIIEENGEEIDETVEEVKNTKKQEIVGENEVKDEK